MKPVPIIACVLGVTAVIFVWSTQFAITPNTVRIESLDDPAKGEWVTMPGFSELGSPTFSRDRQWIAFDAYRRGFNNSYAECWIARREGGNPVLLAAGATPRFSPDGMRVLFVRERVNDPRQQEGVYVINRDGSDARRICAGRWPDWSPDGAHIVFSLGGDETGGARIGATICIARSDGSDRTDLVEGDCPSWSPDGKKIAYCFRARNAAPLIRVHDLKENADATLGVGWFRANWMPDSQSVVANGMIGQTEGMVRLTLKIPRAPSALTSRFAEPSSPCVSWDGKELLYIARMPKDGRP
jgi:Tol biopolymer transport system component